MVFIRFIGICCYWKSTSLLSIVCHCPLPRFQYFRVTNVLKDLLRALDILRINDEITFEEGCGWRWTRPIQSNVRRLHRYRLLKLYIKAPFSKLNIEKTVWCLKMSTYCQMPSGNVSIIVKTDSYLTSIKQQTNFIFSINTDVQRKVIH